MCARKELSSARCLKYSHAETNKLVATLQKWRAWNTLVVIFIYKTVAACSRELRRE